MTKKIEKLIKPFHKNQQNIKKFFKLYLTSNIFYSIWECLKYINKFYINNSHTWLFPIVLCLLKQTRTRIIEVDYLNIQFYIHCSILKVCLSNDISTLQHSKEICLPINNKRTSCTNKRRKSWVPTGCPVVGAYFWRLPCAFPGLHHRPIFHYDLERLRPQCQLPFLRLVIKEKMYNYDEWNYKQSENV